MAIVIDAKSAWRKPHEQLDHLAQVQAAGVHGISITMNGASRETRRPFDWTATLENTLLFRSLIARETGAALLVREPHDLILAQQERKVGILLDLQEAAVFAEDVDRIDTAWVAGIRQVQVTYNRQTPLGAGCAEPAIRATSGGGLSRLGAQVVGRMNALGIVVDCSHAGPRTTLDTIETSTSPVVFSHTGARAIYDCPRNKSDEEIRALGARGGVICVFAVPFLIKEHAGTIDDVIAHIDHCVELVGPEHVGVGTDRALVPETGGITPEAYVEAFRPIVEGEFPPDVFPALIDRIWPPHAEGLRATVELPNLAVRLQERGYPESAIAGILGDNYLRIFQQAHDGSSPDREAEALDRVWRRSFALSNLETR